MGWIKERKGKGRVVGYYYYWKEKKDGRWITLRESLHTKDREEAYCKVYGGEQDYTRKGRVKVGRITFGEFKDKYLNKILPAENKSGYTIRKYENSLKEFQRYLGNKYLDEIEGYHIEEYRLKRREDVSGETVNGDLKALKAFFNRAENFGHKTHSPMKAIKISRGKPRVEIFTPYEIEQIINKSKQDRFLHAVILFMLQTGLRESPVINAKWELLNPDTKKLKITAKYGKERLVFIPRKSYNAINKLMQINEYIFLNRRNRKWVKLYRDISNLCKGLNIHGYPHKFRHTFASYSLACGMPIQTLRDRLGHSSLSITDKYSHVINFAVEGKVKALFNEWNK